MSLDYHKIYSSCLDGNISPALDFLEINNSDSPEEKDLKFKSEFENRFKYSEDRSEFNNGKISVIDGLIKIYINYWRSSLLNNSENYSSLLMKNVAAYLSENQKSSKGIEQTEDSIDLYSKVFISLLGYHTTGFGKTGKFYDLLVWKKEEYKNYSFKMHDEVTNVKVVFMDDFITLGWEEYATLGRYYPGGWATKDSLYCVKKAYDLKSESFKISYLAHESRHFADYKLFPELESADLEYRAKLTELSLLKKNLHDVIKFFINNSNYESENGHSVANYCVIRDLSKALFRNEYEKDINKWKELSPKKINESAYDLLKENTVALNKQGNNVKKFIKS